MAQLIQQQVLEGHTDRVWNVAWSPKGKGADLLPCTGNVSCACLYTTPTGT